MSRKKASVKKLPKESKPIKQIKLISDNGLPTLYLGADISSTHGALVLIDHNGLIDFGGVTKSNTACAKFSRGYIPADLREGKVSEEFLALNKNLGFDNARLIYNNSNYDDCIRVMFNNIRHRFNVKVFIEGFSFSSTGKTFQIAEATGVFKVILYKNIHNLCINEVSFDMIPPTTCKKYYTGSGKADKKEMIAESIKRGMNFGIHAKSDTLEDLADAHALATFGYELDLWRSGHPNKYFDLLEKEGKIDGFRG